MEIRYDSPVVSLVHNDDGKVSGVVCEGLAGREEIGAGAVVLASGGFEALGFGPPFVPFVLLSSETSFLWAA